MLVKFPKVTLKWHVNLANVSTIECNVGKCDLTYHNVVNLGQCWMFFACDMGPFLVACSSEFKTPSKYPSLHLHLLQNVNLLKSRSFLNFYTTIWALCRFVVLSKESRQVAHYVVLQFVFPGKHCFLLYFVSWVHPSNQLKCISNTHLLFRVAKNFQPK